MTRAYTIKNVYDKKHETFEFDGPLGAVLDNAERNGAWMIWGREKNGKTWLALVLANYMSGFEKTLYISSEEGIGYNFVQSCKRAKISPANKTLHFVEYISMPELYKRLRARKGPRVVFIDNVTTFKNELKNGAMEKLIKDFPLVLFIFLAHEKNKKPFTSIAENLSIIAKVKFYVEGLMCEVSGRCIGGQIAIDEEKGALYHGQDILKALNDE